jgi:hypothetical protein
MARDNSLGKPGKTAVSLMLDIVKECGRSNPCLLNVKLMALRAAQIISKRPNTKGKKTRRYSKA